MEEKQLVNLVGAGNTESQEKIAKIDNVRAGSADLLIIRRGKTH